MINICSATKLISNKELFLKVLQNGYTHLRFNFSHINSKEADDIFRFINESSLNIKTIQDLQGPKIRIGNIEQLYLNDVHKLEKYKTFTFYKEGEIINTKLPTIPICFENYKSLKGTKKFIMSNKNSKSNISVLETKEYNWGTAFICMADEDCYFRTRKGLNAIGFDRTRITLSEKDKLDVLWSLKNKVDVIILSFVATAEQITELKEYILLHSSYIPEIWAKIECFDGIKNASNIIKVCDGFMIGRGDMSIEIPLIDIPRVQDELINLCKDENKECIVATHLFDNYNGKINLSDITTIHYLKNVGATGFMMANELIFAKEPIKISKDFNSLINKK